jgi:hypothetical protein
VKIGFVERKTIAICALLLVMAAAAASLFFSRSRHSPRINLNPYQALGTVAAEETSKLLGDRGEIVIVINDPGEERDSVLDAQLETFTRTLKKLGKFTIATVERVKMDAMTRMATGGTMPPERFATVMATHARADAVVLFIGFPMLPPSELNALKAGKTKFIVISAALPGYRELLSAGIIQLAIVPKPGTASEETADPKNLRDWFAREYQIVTPAAAERPPF